MMNTSHTFALLALVVGLSLLVTGCSGMMGIGFGANAITPSNVTTSEVRDVGSFSGIQIRTFGDVLIRVGDSESLTVEGRDNLVPLVNTSTRDGTLVIEMEESVNILSANSADLLSFHITVRELNALEVSGLASVELDGLTTTSLILTVSGAGNVQLHDLAAKRLSILLSGLGNVEARGEVVHAMVEISGAGEVRAGDLKCQTADVDVPGLGSATLWVTDALSGTISGAGNISYYGSPETNTDTTGLGRFDALGEKQG